MAKRYQIPVVKVDDNHFTISKNKSFLFLIQGSYGLYERIAHDMARQDGLPDGYGYLPNATFTNLIAKAMNDNGDELFSKSDVERLMLWIDSIVIIVVEKQESNLKDKHLKKYLKIAQNFMDELKTHLTLPTAKIN